MGVFLKLCLLWAKNSMLNHRSALQMISLWECLGWNFCTSRYILLEQSWYKCLRFAVRCSTQDAGFPSMQVILSQRDSPCVLALNKGPASSCLALSPSLSYSHSHVWIIEEEGTGVGESGDPAGLLFGISIRPENLCFSFRRTTVPFCCLFKILGKNVSGPFSNKLMSVHIRVHKVFIPVWFVTSPCMLCLSKAAVAAIAEQDEEKVCRSVEPLFDWTRQLQPSTNGCLATNSILNYSWNLSHIHFSYCTLVKTSFTADLMQQFVYI